MNNNVDFGISDIKEIATSISYYKGVEYYEDGSVRSIIRRGNVFTGTVYGSRDYDVTINSKGQELSFNCTCPYDFDGICKHCIAMALAVLNGEFKTENIIEDSVSITWENFNSIKPEKRLEFLYNLISVNSDVRNQFNSYFFKVESNTDLNQDITDRIKNIIFNELSTIDFDSILESAERNYRYERYYEEDYDSAAEDAVDRILAKHFTEIEKLISSGDYFTASSILFGLYEGCQLLSDDVDCEFDIFVDGYKDSVMGIFENKLNEIIKQIEKILIPESAVESILNHLSVRIKLTYEYNKEIDEQEDDESDDIILYFVGFWETYLRKLAYSNKTAQMLLQFLDDNNLEGIDCVPLILHAAELIGDTGLWYSTAEKFSDIDMETSSVLISRLKRDQRIDEFEKRIIKSFELWPDRFDNYVIEYLDKKKYTSLYIKALTNYTKTKRSINHYILLREYLNEEQRKSFVDKFSSTYHYDFLSELLNIEKRYDDILELVIKLNKNSHNINKIIVYILKFRPKECYELLKSNCLKALESHGRDRSTYRTIIEWVNIMQKIDNYQLELRSFIGQLYNHKPALPALRDEIKKAGLRF